jgi:hypothetical protein
LSDSSQVKVQKPSRKKPPEFQLLQEEPCLNHVSVQRQLPSRTKTTVGHEKRILATHGGGKVNRRPPNRSNEAAARISHNKTGKHHPKIHIARQTK